MGLFESDIFTAQWQKNNFKVIDYPDRNDGYCYIYFSGNGVYDPNTEVSFNKSIVENDRYEWNRWKGKSQKEIFVRDCYKVWYQKGISDKCDSIEKLYRLLKELTLGLKIVTIGNSAGGYGATLFGALLCAERVYGFSSQYDIARHLQTHLLYDEIKKETGGKYFNLWELLYKKGTQVLYFYPTLVKDDIYQMECIKDIPNVHCIGIKSKLHGKAVYSNNLPKLLNLDEIGIQHLCEKYENKETNPFLFSLSTVGVKLSMVGFFFNSIKPIYYKYNDYIRKLSRKGK